MTTLNIPVQDLLRATPAQIDALRAVCCTPGLYGPVQPSQPRPKKRQRYTRGDGKRFDKRTGEWK